MKKHTCHKKKSYKSARDAHCAIGLIQKTSNRDKVPNRAYKCEACNMWHLSSKPRWKDDD